MRLRTLRIFLWLAVALAGLGAFFLYQRQAVTVTQIDQAFRPEFTLADAQGQARSSADFRGKYQLIFFGFTNCPDVCPTTLSEVAQVMDDLGSDAEKVQPLFISIDPERDRKLGSAGLTAKHALLLAVGLRYRRMRSSMLAAIERGRPPAIDFLNGEIVTRGQAAGVPTPINAKIVQTVWAIARGEVASSRALLDQMLP